MADGAAAPFAVRFHRAFDVAAVVTVALWQVGAAGAALLVYLDRYRSPAAAAAVWGVQLAVIAAGAVLLLRGTDRPGAVRLLVAVDLATGLAMAANCPGDLLLKIDWGWATTGLIGVLLLLNRPVSRLVLLQAANGGIILAALAATGGLDRHGAAGFVTLLYASASIQFTMFAGAREFRTSGGMAATAAAARWETASREAMAREVALARQGRYQEVRELVTPILRGLADGTVDPADTSVRRRCGTAEAMLRQLLAEREDIPDALLQVLRPGIDEAMRRGVVVDMVRVGDLTALDERAAVAVAEVPLAVLAKARGRARVTVVPGGDGGVSVSVLADADVPLPCPRAGPDVAVTSDHDGDLLWVEALWNRP